MPLLVSALFYFFEGLFVTIWLLTVSIEQTDENVFLLHTFSTEIVFIWHKQNSDFVPMTDIMFLNILEHLCR